MSRIRLSTQIWGQEYARLFFREIIPLVEKSIENLKEHDVDFHAYLDAEAEDILSERMQCMGVPITFIPLEEITKDTWIYTRENDCKFHCLNQAVDDDATVIFVDPNQVISPKNWAYFIKQIEQGYNGVTLCSIRTLYKGEILPEFKDHEQMVKYTIDHIHPCHAPWFSDVFHKAQKMNTAGMFFHRTSYGLACRVLHTAFPCVKPTKKGLREGCHADWCFQSGWGIDIIKVVTDSDDAYSFELNKEGFASAGLIEFPEVPSYLDRIRDTLPYINVGTQTHAFTDVNLKNYFSRIHHHYATITEEADEFFEQTEKIGFEEQERRRT